MGFITIFHHHLGEYFCFFSRHLQQIKVFRMAYRFPGSNTPKQSSTITIPPSSPSFASKKKYPSPSLSSRDHCDEVSLAVRPIVQIHESVWPHGILGGNKFVQVVVSNFLKVSSLFGEDSQFDQYFSDGLKLSMV